MPPRVLVGFWPSGPKPCRGSYLNKKKQDKGPVALGRIFVYFAKKTVNECCRRVRPAFFALTKFCPTLPNFKEAATKNRRAPWASRIFVRRFYRNFLFV